MNSAGHFKEAERLLSAASHGDFNAPVTQSGRPLEPSAHAALIAKAHVHAILVEHADRLSGIEPVL